MQSVDVNHNIPPRSLARDDSTFSLKSASSLFTEFDASTTQMTSASSRMPSPAFGDDSDAASPALSDSLSFDLDFEELIEANDASGDTAADGDAFMFANDNTEAKDDDLEQFNALAQIVADYGLATLTALDHTGDSAVFDVVADGIIGHHSKSAMEMVFSPSNLVVGQALIDRVGLPPMSNATVPSMPQQTGATSELLRILTNSAIAQAALGNSIVAAPTPAPAADAPPATASPAELSLVSPLPQPVVIDSKSPVAVSAAVQTSTADTEADTSSNVRQTSKRKRVADPNALLPLDAPIQPRQYKGASATSRKPLPGVDPQAASDAAVQAPAPKRGKRASCAASLADSAPPVVSAQLAKRMSNTLAARRSRHRKAEELKQLHDTIEDLTAQVEEWKRKYEEMKWENERLGKHSNN
ncbi:hypothetical protein K437DRAFT_265802 [Tilletiaria anomala UBC 951]|uniref:BZIP domain-containing protein n=1 Tax=Tilletiaria anomala (strain ATCC 24038 / CBS 436.72 / UBC 951) TaxID=1037660 RepID=A0A066WLH1_TILAU|nr:uncharacterized protein K437DRAFT_265802 [Tilletiaria anomala UBC 951]KDN53438.1 hypothetical protein K437DRAFT_265802 [Tilletiaria anomala UBC 951]